MKEWIRQKYERYKRNMTPERKKKQLEYIKERRKNMTPEQKQKRAEYLRKRKKEKRQLES